MWTQKNYLFYSSTIGTFSVKVIECGTFEKKKTRLTFWMLLARLTKQWLSSQAKRLFQINGCQSQIENHNHNNRVFVSHVDQQFKIKPIRDLCYNEQLNWFNDARMSIKLKVNELRFFLNKLNSNHFWSDTANALPDVKSQSKRLFSKKKKLLPVSLSTIHYWHNN